MELPTISQYAGNNTTRVVVGNVTVWYSYTTPVAFQVGDVRVVRENTFSKTTGGHINAIDGGPKGGSRVTATEFQRLWEELVR